MSSGPTYVSIISKCTYFSTSTQWKTKKKKEASRKQQSKHDFGLFMLKVFSVRQYIYIYIERERERERELMTYSLARYIIYIYI